MSKRERDVVVTGIGCISHLGKDLPSTFAALQEGRYAFSPLDFQDKYPEYDSLRQNAKYIGAIPNGWVEEGIRKYYPSKSDLARIPRAAQLAVIASDEALRNGAIIDCDGTVFPWIDKDNFSVVVGTGLGTYSEIISAGIKPLIGKRISGYDAFNVIQDMVASTPAATWGLRGPSSSVSGACASSGVALRVGVSLIQQGDAEIVLVGGPETILHPVFTATYTAIGAITKGEDQETASRPFNNETAGFVPSEAAGMYVIESRESAERRGARIYASIAGYGSSIDAIRDDYTNPDFDGNMLAMKKAITKAGGLPEGRISFYPHGTGTKSGDSVERDVAREIFSTNKATITLQAVKSQLGHSLGASHAMSVVLAMESFFEGLCLPNPQIDIPLEGMEIFQIPRVSERIIFDAAIVKATGFRGYNEVAIFRNECHNRAA